METSMISVDRFTRSAQEVAQRAAEIMQRYSHNQIDTEQLLLALIEQPQGQLLEYWDDILFVYAGSVAHPEAILRPGTNRKVHHTQMPVNLAARCILFSTDKEDT